MDNENRNDLFPQEDAASEPAESIAPDASEITEAADEATEIQDEGLQENEPEETVADAQDDIKSGEYHYTGAQYNQQWGQSSQPSWQQPPAQNNGYQQPRQNNGYNQGGYPQQNQNNDFAMFDESSSPF